MHLLKEEGIHLALDTCGGVSWEKLGPLVDLADMVLYDLKVMDGEKHRTYTGIPLETVLENGKKVAETGKPMWIRTPIIPGYTDTKKNIERVAVFIRTYLPCVERYDLLSFNNTCSKKYQRLDLGYLLEDKELKSETEMKELVRIAEEQGLENIHWGGFTRN
jgi:pyruvate formate lyase activating enzyme